jgi:hypothetical protein
MRYAVVREGVMQKSFGKWHETKQGAIEEASRLCSKEGKEIFIVLQECALVRPQAAPVEVIEVIS